MATHEEMMRELNNILSDRDWYTHFSDDHRVYMAGVQADAMIKVMVQECGRDGERLLQAHKDINFGPHTGFAYHYPEDSTNVDKA